MGGSSSNNRNPVSRNQNINNECKTPSYIVYVDYSIFALIFLSVYLWLEICKSMFLYQYSHKSLRGEFGMSKLYATFIFTIIVTVLTIILIVIFHPTLNNDSNTQTEEEEIRF